MNIVLILTLYFTTTTTTTTNTTTTITTTTTTGKPRVINLNQDPLFSECLVYYIPEGAVSAGGDEHESDILLSGPDILNKVCMYV